MSSGDRDEYTTLVENDYVVDALRGALTEGEHGLSVAPRALRTVVETGAWQKRIIVKTGEIREFRSFREFVTTPALEGLGTSIDVLRKICQDEPELLKMIDEPLGRHGGERKTEQGDIITLPQQEATKSAGQKGTSEDYTRRRLRRDHPDLYEQVLDGQLSANKAAQTAGFRRAMASIPVDSADEAIKSLLRRFSKQELLDALERLR